MIVSEAQAAAHLRLDIEGLDTGELAAQDMMLTLYLSAAIERCVQHLNRAVYESQEALDQARADTESAGQTFDEYAMVVNDAIRAAVLLTVGHLWENRMDVVPGTMIELPRGSLYLLQPYRKRMGA